MNTRFQALGTTLVTLAFPATALAAGSYTPPVKYKTPKTVYVKGDQKFAPQTANSNQQANVSQRHRHRRQP